mmetsp:Transcript_38531/g.120610  ORF Transcript_38531/g.120610 Transcript_38531/m.120610 type:complete len:310 (-) Transcript_38531:78-1007(-)
MIPSRRHLGVAPEYAREARSGRGAVGSATAQRCRVLQPCPGGRIAGVCIVIRRRRGRDLWQPRHAVAPATARARTVVAPAHARGAVAVCRRVHRIPPGSPRHGALAIAPVSHGGQAALRQHAARPRAAPHARSRPRPLQLRKILAAVIAPAARARIDGVQLLEPVRALVPPIAPAVLVSTGPGPRRPLPRALQGRSARFAAVAAHGVLAGHPVLRLRAERTPPRLHSAAHRTPFLQSPLPTLRQSSGLPRNAEAGPAPPPSPHCPPPSPGGRAVRRRARALAGTGVRRSRRCGRTRTNWQLFARRRKGR